MYWLTPFKYLLESFLALLLQGIPIRCTETELARFSPPPGQSCEGYAGPFVDQSGGYLETLGNGQCGFCQYRDGTRYAASFNIFPSHIWRNFGVVAAYIVFNFAAVFFFTWLYLGGAKKIKGLVNLKERKARRRAEKGRVADEKA